MARTDDSQPESFASPEPDGASEDLPGELLADDLVDPAPYEVAADETEAEELDAATTTDDPEQLEEATTAAAVARNSRPQRRSAVPVEAKGAPTPKRRGSTAVATERRTTPAKFVNESVEELKKVVWPTSTQVRQYYWVVLVFVLAVTIFVALLDFAFGWVLLRLFG